MREKTLDGFEVIALVRTARDRGQRREAETRSRRLGTPGGAEIHSSTRVSLQKRW